MKILRRIVLFAFVLMSVGCSGTGVGIGFQPRFIPIKIIVDSSGVHATWSSQGLDTLIGTFSLEAQTSLTAIANRYNQPVLVVQVDSLVKVYNLEQGKEFRVEFDDSNKLYRRVSLNYSDTGDILLKLESVSQTANLSSFGSTVNSCPGAPPQRLEVNEDAKICTKKDRVILRSGPGRHNSELTRLEPKSIVWVLDGPSCANNWSWWKVRTSWGLVGWMAEGGDSKDDYFLCPN